MPTLLSLIEVGWLALLDYLAAHVILCLLPAFFIAGALSTLIPKEAITRYLGPDASKWVSYPAAALGGFVLAVCSCTILPLFAGIWRRGAGLGPAITFLFVGPAVNILAIAYTGAALGLDFATARIVLALSFGLIIGLLMAFFFRHEVREKPKAAFGSEERIRPAVWAFLGLMILLLVAGTLQIDLLTNAALSWQIANHLPNSLQTGLNSLHLTAQGALLVALLVLLGGAGWLGLEKVLDGFSGWTRLALALVALTMLAAAPVVTETNSYLIEITGRTLAVTLLLAAIALVAWRGFSHSELAGWLWETWKFVKQIFPILILGVFLAGVARALVPGAWVQSLAGENTLLANFLGVVFGVFMYFPTLVEVPVARAFLDLGMHRGPLLAYLLADPELSLQSMLVTGRILGRSKTIVYVVLVAIFSTVAGYAFGLWVTP